MTIGSEIWRVRTARVPPKKQGAFVAVWKRDEAGETMRFASDGGTVLTLPLLINLYKWYDVRMVSVTLSQFRNRQSDYIAAAQRDPVEITSRGARRRAVVVSPDFYDRAIAALEDQADIRAAAAARRDPEGRIPFDELMEELGI